MSAIELGARHTCPASARFVQVDPVEGGSWTLRLRRCADSFVRFVDRCRLVSGMVPAPPILVIDRDGSDVFAFQTPTAASGFMEPPEVAENAYRVFDANGHEAVLGIRGWEVVLDAWSPVAREDELRALLLLFLAQCHISVSPGASLNEVVHEAARSAQALERDRIRPRILRSVVRWLGKAT